MTDSQPVSPSEPERSRSGGEPRPPDRRPPGDGLRRRNLYGLDLVNEPGLEPVLEAVLDHGRVEHEALPVLVTPNVDILIQLDQHPESPEAEIFRRAAYVLPDGMPLVVASRLLRRPLEARLPGSGLFELLWPRLVADGRRVVLLCASEEIVERLDPGTDEVRFVIPPWFDVRNDTEVDGVVEDLLEAATSGEAEYVLLGMGHPKDAVVAGRFLHHWPATDRPAPLLLGLGGSFAMLAGIKKRAPGWVQRIGMEWFYRFVQEPRRLFRRYFVEDPGFLRLVVAEARGGRGARRDN
jgi:N-acetylglucosaminyldiphosphoundecaprenol N-acetyl-beta-D-mannosaminyltransferase